MQKPSFSKSTREQREKYWRNPISLTLSNLQHPSLITGLHISHSATNFFPPNIFLWDYISSIFFPHETQLCYTALPLCLFQYLFSLFATKPMKKPSRNVHCFAPTMEDFYSCLLSFGSEFRINNCSIDCTLLSIT